jgi:hypothetical protein
MQLKEKEISLDGARVAHEFWTETRVLPALGRLFVPDEYTAPPSRAVVLLSDDLWKEKFNSDPGTIGQEIYLDGIPTTVVGILPPEFQFPGRTRLWVPKTS